MPVVGPLMGATGIDCERCGHDASQHGCTSGCALCPVADAHVFTQDGAEFPTTGNDQGGFGAD